MDIKKGVIAIYNETITDKAIAEIELKHKDLIHDFTNEEEFKAARKVRTEMNKLLEQVDRIGIDAVAQVTETRNDIKQKIEIAYSGTVTPFLIENQKRLDEAKRIKKEKDDRIAMQKQELEKIKGASARAIHLPFDDIEEILQDIMGIDLSRFDDDMRQEASFAKDVAISQISEAMKFAQQKDEMRKAMELQKAESADKDDEIERMRKQIEALTGAKQESVKRESVNLGAAISSYLSEVELLSDESINELMRIVSNYVSLESTI